MFKFLQPGQRAMDSYSKGQRVFPKLQYVQRGLLDNLERAVKYNSKHASYIANGNLLKQLLTLLPIIDELNDKQLTSRVRGMYPTFSTALNISSESNPGDFVTGNIYGNIKELWIGVFDTVATSPIIRVLRHPFTTTNLPAFTGDTYYDNLDDTDIAVFSIDVPRLAVLYRNWVVANSKLPSDEQEPVEFFISTVIMPSLLESHQYVSVFNLLRSRLVGTRRLEDEQVPGLTLVDYTSKLVDALDDVVEYLLERKLELSQILKDTPLTIDRTVQDIVGLRTLSTNRMVLWGSFLADIPLVLFLFEVLEQSGTEMDGQIRNTIKKEIKLLKNDGGLRNRLSDEAGDLLKAEITYLLSLV